MVVQLKKIIVNYINVSYHITDSIIDTYVLLSGSYHNLKDEIFDYSMIYPNEIYKLIEQNLYYQEINSNYFYIEYKYQNIDNELDIKLSYKTISEQEAFLYKQKTRIKKLERLND